MADMILLDFMAEGSSMAHLMFSQSVLRIMKSRNAVEVTIEKCEEDVEADAQKVRTRVFKFAFRALGRNHMDRKIAMRKWDGMMDVDRRAQWMTVADIPHRYARYQWNALAPQYKLRLASSEAMI